MAENQIALPQILIIGDFPFPTGSAASNNLRGHCQALKAAGFSVGLLPAQDKGREEDRQSDGTYKYQGCQYWPVYHPLENSRKAYLRRLFLGDEDTRLEFLKKHDLKGVRAILLYPSVVGTVPHILSLNRLCKEKHLDLWVYVVEWHDWKHLRGSLYWSDIFDGEIQRRWLNPSLSGVICITAHLGKYYEQKGQKSVRIPPLLDLQDNTWSRYRKSPESVAFRPLKLLFSGSAGRERHDLILKSVLDLRKRGLPVVMEYLGTSLKQIVAIPGVTESLINDLGEGIVFHGRVPQERVYEIASAASFCVLLREDTKWSQSCFPSKVPEFLALGVPILCNFTSDLSMYLQDGHNAIVIKDLSSAAFSEAIERILKLSEVDYQQIRRAAWESAAQFDALAFSPLYKQMLGASPRP